MKFKRFHKHLPKARVSDPLCSTEIFDVGRCILKGLNVLDLQAIFKIVHCFNKILVSQEFFRCLCLNITEFHSSLFNSIKF